MKEPESQPQLSCQELSKQCNDIDSSSSVASCSDVCRQNLCRTLFPSSQKPSHHKKDSIGSPMTRVWDEIVKKEKNMTRSLRSELAQIQEDPTNFSVLEMHHHPNNDGDDDDDDIYDDGNEVQDADTRNQNPCDYSNCDWLYGEDAKCSYVSESQDFLDEMESTLHLQVDDEIDAFRSSLHAIISQQNLQCRHLLREQDDCTSQSYFNPEQDRSPSQTVSEDVWSSDLMLNSSDQQRLEAMSTSTASLQGEDRGMQYISTTEDNGSSREELLNRITIQLLTSALAISNALHREEYATKHEL